MREFLKNQEYNLPPTWDVGQHRLKGNTLAIFINSADGAPGSSGSPVVNRAGRLVGIVYAGTSASSLSFVEGKSISEAVASAGIRDVLEKVYEAHDLIKELNVQQTYPKK
jgi:S1-C subfamily serine protease